MDCQQMCVFDSAVNVTLKRIHLPTCASPPTCCLPRTHSDTLPLPPPQATKSLNKGKEESVPLFPWNAPDWSK